MENKLENLVLNHELMYISKQNQAGWDDLYEHCFSQINQIVEDNLKQEHNPELIKNTFEHMKVALERAKERMDKLGGDKNSWYRTYNTILEYSETAYTSNEKVITINMIDQHLRSSY